MAKSYIKEGAKRYYIAINQVAHERMTEILKGIGAPQGTLSTMIDEYVQGSVVLFEHMLEVKKKEGRNPTFIEAMGAISKMIDVSGAKKSA